MKALRYQQIKPRETNWVGLKVAGAVSECANSANNLDEFMWGFATRIKEMKSGNSVIVESSYRAIKADGKIQVYKLTSDGIQKRMLFEISNATEDATHTGPK